MAAGEAGADVSAILAQLAESTQRLMEEPKEGDTWKITVEKMCRKRKIVVPTFISSLNSFCLVTPTFWPMLIYSEKVAAVAAIQNYLRAKCHQANFLVEEVCSLALALHNVIVALDGKSPKFILDVAEPLLSVIDGKVAYIIARVGGSSATRAAYVSESTNDVNVGSPTLRLANKSGGDYNKQNTKKNGAPAAKQTHHRKKNKKKKDDEASS